MAKSDYDLSYTQDRELSWLKFDLRVLEEAENPKVPLLERLRFLSIFTSNLDEFFMVRVGSLLDNSIMMPDEVDTKSGGTAAEQLNAIYETVPGMLERREKAYKRICAKLSKKGISELSFRKLKGKEKSFVKKYYEFNVRPILSPQIIDRSHPFPHLKNKCLYAAALLTNLSGDKKILGIVEIPDSLPKLLYLTADEEIRFLRMETVVLNYLERIFKRYTVTDKAIISVIRNADISFDDDETDNDGPSHREHMSSLLKVRDRLAPVWLEIEGDSRGIGKLLAKNLGLNKNQIYYSGAPSVIKWAYSLATDRKDLLYPAFKPRWPGYLDPSVPMKDQIAQRDVLLFYPYHSIDPFLNLLREASKDKNVTSIAITLYRVARGSQVVKYLVDAVENGKEVSALVELRARFDEENNIEWARVLEDSGCRITYGKEGFKCHSKICLITYKTPAGVSYITQVGTGNYNEKTATQYTDFCLMSADRTLGEDAEAFFKDMFEERLEGGYKKLLTAPHDMKPRIMSLIDREIAKGENGRIVIKTNSVTERDLINKFSEASRAGVSIDLIVRGICCLTAGVPEKTDNIRVTSIVGRFLEHSRIYSFGTGEEQIMYISSADIMTRNQLHRVEIACPVESAEIRAFLNSYIGLLLSDNVNARRMIYPGDYVRKPADKRNRVNVQQYYIDHEIGLSPTVKSAFPIITKIKEFFAPIFRSA